MANKVEFNGLSKQITILSGVTVLDVQIDLYSEWKRWCVLDDNLKFLQAFRTFGGDQTISGQFAPRYFFLMNGWRIVVDNGEDLLVGINLYTDELDSPFIVSNDSTVILNNTDAPVVDTGIAETLDYGGVVVLNTFIGVSTTDYPSGTIAQPVNSLSAAKIVADRYGITTINIFGHVHFDVDLEGFVVIGGNINDVVHFHSDVNIDKTTFKQCVLTGHYTGTISADNCIIEDHLHGMDGYFQYCGFKGEMHFDPNVTTVFNDCHSQIPGTASPIMTLNENVALSLRKYSGGMAIYNCLSGTTGTLEFLVGNCRLLSGNTGGELVIRGLATLTDNSSGTTVNTSGLLIPHNVATQHSLNVNTEITKNS